MENTWKMREIVQKPLCHSQKYLIWTTLDNALIAWQSFGPLNAPWITSGQQSDGNRSLGSVLSVNNRKTEQNIQLNPCCLFSRRLLEEEALKRTELEQIHLQQQRVLSQTEAERQELAAEQLAKERELQTAVQQLQRLEKERQGALEQYQVRHEKRLQWNGNSFCPYKYTWLLHVCLICTGGVEETGTSSKQDKDLERQSGQTRGAGASHPAR